MEKHITFFKLGKNEVCVLYNNAFIPNFFKSLNLGSHKIGGQQQTVLLCVLPEALCIGTTALEEASRTFESVKTVYGYSKSCKGYHGNR